MRNRHFPKGLNKNDAHTFHTGAIVERPLFLMRSPCPQLQASVAVITSWLSGGDHSLATPCAPAHHAQLLRHSAPRVTAHLRLEPVHNHGGAQALQCEHNHVGVL